MEKIDQAIFKHSRLKFHLKNAIETAEDNVDHEEIKNHRVCQLGKWLDSTEGKALPNRSEIIELHKNFHEEASQILDLALQGRKDEAIMHIQPLTSKFSQLSSQLVNKLAEIG